jgi:hydrogenase-1 operon protein HyaE
MSTAVKAPPPLMARLITDHGAQWVSLETLEAWKAEPGDAVLLIAGDGVRFPEGLDVAIVLPELRQAVSRPFRIGVALADDEDDIGQRFGAQRRPSLVFLRDGRYVTTVAGMHDWGDYIKLVSQALDMPTTYAPIGIAVEGSAGSSACH